MKLFRILLISTFVCWFFQLTATGADYTTLSLPEGAVKRLGKGVITGNVAFSPNGFHLAVGSSIGIWIYEIRQDMVKEIDLLTGHTDSVYTIAYSRDGRMLASGSWDNTIRLWDGQTGLLIETLEGHTDKVNCVVFSGDGNFLASGSNDKTVKLWDIETGDVSYTNTDHTDSVTSVAFSPNGNFLASGSKDKTIGLINVQTKDHTHEVTTIAFSSDSNTLASGGKDKTIRLWDIHNNESVIQLNEVTGIVNSLIYFLKEIDWQAWICRMSYIYGTEKQDNIILHLE